MSNNISLCITSYNKDIHLIHNLLPYIEQQTLLPSEIILFCSGIDGQIDLKTTLPIKFVTQKTRCIQSQARNICSKIANQNIIIFFDIDDYPHPQKIEATYKYISDYDFLVHSYINSANVFETIDLDTVIKYDNLTIDPQSTNIECGQKPIHHAHIAVKKYVFSNVKFNEDILYYRREDGKFCQDLLLAGYKGIFLDYPFVLYT